MAKKNNTDITKELMKYVNNNIRNVNMGETCTDYMKIFGANIKLLRHIPIVIDGLKPVERRSLYCMYEDLKLSHKSDFLKVATIVGSTMGHYHPHGDSSIYEAIVRMGQYWSTPVPMVDRLGNFGSPAGMSAAAARYIEAKLTKYAYKCFFEEFDKNVVDMKDTFTGRRLEPEYLPAKYPNILFNAVTGIGYGVKSDIPTFNFTEALELTLKLLEDPDYEDVFLIPDSPTGCNIVDEGQFREMCISGKGNYKMQGNIKIEDNRITIYTVPYQVNPYNSIYEKIKELAQDGSIRGIKGHRDYCGEIGPDGIRHDIALEFTVKPEIDPRSVVATIFKKTDMIKTFSTNLIVINDYAEETYNLKSLILEWLDYRRDFKRAIYNHRMKRIKEREHILNILIFILNKDNAEKTLSMVKKSRDKKEIVNNLMKAYGITSLQASTIADMRLTAFSTDARASYVKELSEMEKEIKECTKMLKKPQRIDDLIKEELEEGIRLFGFPRRSKVVHISDKKSIPNTNHILIFTKNGLIKKLPERSTNIGKIANGDTPLEIKEVSNLTDLLIFDSAGKVFKLPVYNIADSELNKEGDKLSDYCRLSGKIVSIIPKPTQDVMEDIKLPISILMITENGIIKKTSVEEFMNIRNELIAIKLKEGFELKNVKLLAGDKDIIVYTDKGMGTRYNSSEIKDTGRNSMGIKGIVIDDDEKVIGMDLINPKEKYIFVLTNKGRCKKCTLNHFSTKERTSKSLRLITLEDDEKIVLVRTVKGKEKFKVYMKSAIIELDMEDVPELPRMSKGRKMIPVKLGDCIIDIKENI